MPKRCEMCWLHTVTIAQRCSVMRRDILRSTYALVSNLEMSVFGRHQVRIIIIGDQLNNIQRIFRMPITRHTVEQLGIVTQSILYQWRRQPYQ